MNAEQFYQEFKNSLSHLGVRWGDMAEVEVWVEDDTFYMMLDGKQTSLAVLLDSPKPAPVGVNGLTEAETDSSMSVQGLSKPTACSPLCQLCVKRGYRECANVAKTTPLPALAQPDPVELTDADCTRIYNAANGITDKNPPISTKFIFAAMRAAAKGGAV